MATPPAVFHFETVDSTQDEARARYAGEPVLVTAGAQRQGRGRGGAEWRDAPRPIAASLCWEPGWPEAALPRLTLVAGLAALDALEHDLSLKWPNDVMRAGDKVAGILTEAGKGVVVVGLGANLWWPDPPQGVGAVFTEDPGVAAARDLAGIWAQRLLERASDGPDDWGREEYAAHCITLGQEIAWDPSGRGVARAIDRGGGLIVETVTGDIVIDVGAVRHVRTAGGGG